MIFQLEEDLVHLERGRQRFDEDRHLDRAARNVQRLLRVHEDVVPQTRFEMALHLRQVEVRTSACRFESRGVVEQIHAEVEEHSGNRTAVDDEMALGQVEAARPDHQRRKRRFERVRLLRVPGATEDVSSGVAASMRLVCPR